MTDRGIRECFSSTGGVRHRSGLFWLQYGVIVGCCYDGPSCCQFEYPDVDHFLRSVGCPSSFFVQLSSEEVRELREVYGPLLTPLTEDEKEEMCRELDSFLEGDSSSVEVIHEILRES